MNRFFTFILVLISFISCHKKQELPENILLKFDDKFLTYEEVIDLIPSGLHPSDSVAMFKAIVDGWIENVVLSDFAEEHLYDVSEIDRLVRQYRNDLIVQEYLSKMRDSSNPKVEEQKVKEYYDLHRKELKLEEPLIKGIFIKINSDSKGKEDIKRLLSSENPEDIDKLEREWLDRALQYNYFKDKWIDWETVAGLIPYRFGDPGIFLNENYSFETEYEDCNYYLQVTDYLAPGNEQPYEFARTWISDILSQGELAEYERNLVNSLLKKSIRDNRLEIIGYDPLKQEIIRNIR